MYRDRLSQAQIKSDDARRLQLALLHYHDFRKHHRSAPAQALQGLAAWQSARLLQTHNDLYQLPGYRDGITFLFNELYSAQNFDQRDNDLERIFPKLLKLMPNKVLGTVAAIVELNLCTQELDIVITEQLLAQGHIDTLNEEYYAEAYRRCDNKAQRLKQLELVAEVGDKLNRYARSRSIMLALKASRRPAELAGLAALHGFIHRGFTAFHSMQDIPHLMQTIVHRERAILAQIFAGDSAPFQI